MDLNITLLGEIITFAVLIFVTMKYIWPPVTKAMEERQQKIASGLQAAERAENDLKIAQDKAKKILSSAQNQAKTILTKTEEETSKILEASKLSAQKESEQILTNAEITIQKEKSMAKEELQKHLADLVMLNTKKILEEKVDAGMQDKLVDQFIADLDKEH
ncbi:MAG: F0F1 ATP synthase subunit B [Gammaproteobacteria bacterium]